MSYIRWYECSMSYLRSIYFDNLKKCAKEFAKEFKSARKFEKFLKGRSKEVKLELESMLDLVSMSVTSDRRIGNGCKSEVMDNDINDWYPLNPKVYRIFTFLRKPKRFVKLDQQLYLGDGERHEEFGFVFPEKPPVTVNK